MSTMIAANPAVPWEHRHGECVFCEKQAERLRALEAELANKDKLWNAILSEAGMEEAKAWERWYHGHKRATIPKTLIDHAEKAEAELDETKQKLGWASGEAAYANDRAEKAESEVRLWKAARKEAKS